eukprot:Rhum_TRINITY_DN13624_c0_g2::Rhum_TRINITY_DN13624_c0_g2_i1::g.62104::m.62104
MLAGLLHACSCDGGGQRRSVRADSGGRRGTCLRKPVLAASAMKHSGWHGGGGHSKRCLVSHHRRSGWHSGRRQPPFPAGDSKARLPAGRVHHLHTSALLVSLCAGRRVAKCGGRRGICLRDRRKPVLAAGAMKHSGWCGGGHSKRCPVSHYCRSGWHSGRRQPPFPAGDSKARLPAGRVHHLHTSALLVSLGRRVAKCGGKRGICLRDRRKPVLAAGGMKHCGHCRAEWPGSNPLLASGKTNRSEWWRRGVGGGRCRGCLCRWRIASSAIRYRFLSKERGNDEVQGISVDNKKGKKEKRGGNVRRWLFFFFLLLLFF